MKPVRIARLLFQLPRESRVFTAFQPANQWQWQEFFLNKIVHLMEMRIWQASYDPKKKAQHDANKPKLFEPDFIKNALREQSPNKDIESHTITELNELLSRPRS